MRSARPWVWRCSPPPESRWRAASRPATGTASPSRPPLPPGWRSPARFWPPWCGPLPARRWRCTDVPAHRGTGRGAAPAAPASYHRQIADRNAQTILDAAEELLRLEGHSSISAVAALAGVSRVTVYAHFPTWEALLEAAVQRAVTRIMAALESE